MEEIFPSRQKIIIIIKPHIVKAAFLPQMLTHIFGFSKKLNQLFLRSRTHANKMLCAMFWFWFWFFFLMSVSYFDDKCMVVLLDWARGVEAGPQYIGFIML